VCNSKILAEEPCLVKVPLDLVSWLVNRSESGRGSNTFGADEDNIEPGSPESFEKLAAVFIFPHWKGGGRWP